MAQQHQVTSLDEAMKAIPWLPPEVFARLVREETGMSVKEFRRRNYEEKKGRRG